MFLAWNKTLGIPGKFPNMEAFDKAKMWYENLPVWAQIAIPLVLLILIVLLVVWIFGGFGGFFSEEELTGFGPIAVAGLVRQDIPDDSFKDEPYKDSELVQMLWRSG